MAKIDKLTQLAKEHLEPAEEVVSTVLGVYETKLLGKDTVRNGIFLATDRRIIFYGKKAFGYDMEVFPYSNISSIEMGKGLMGYTIAFFASGNKVSMKWIGQGQVKEFVDYVKQNIGKKATASPQVDIPEQIKKLSELKEQGVLSEEEFESKKAELLARM